MHTSINKYVGLVLIGMCAIGCGYLVSYHNHSIEKLFSSLPTYTQTAAIAGSNSGLILHYTFDETAGTSASDASGNGNDGTLVNGPEWSSQSKVGSGALQFDGTDYINIPDVERGLSAMTISAWTKPDDLSGRALTILEEEGGGNDPLIFDWGNGSSSNESKFRCAVANDANAKATATTPSQYTGSVWHHVVCTYDGSVVKLYVDGVHVATSGTISGAISSTGSGLNISTDAGGANWSGLLDDIRIYNRALDTSDIGSLFELGGGEVPEQPASSPVSTPTQTPDTNPSSDTPPTTTTPSTNPPASQPANTSGTYYVDQNHPQASDSNSGTEEFPFKTIQKAADVAQAGHTILIKEGIYLNDLDKCKGSSCFFVQMRNSGTASKPITIKAFENDSVILEGFGFEDRDLNGDGFADGPKYPSKRESLLWLFGDHIHVSNLEFRNSEGNALNIDGNYNRVENVSLHDNWAASLVIGGGTTGRVEGNIVRYAELYKSRHGNGLTFARPADPKDLVTNNLVEYSLAYLNGKATETTNVLPLQSDPAGGGNSDGMGATKFCNDEPKVNGITNFCPNNIFRGNIIFNNGDDGFDVSFADSIFENNISFGNGGAAGGGKGYKVLRDIKNLTFVGNIAYANKGPGFELRVVEGLNFINNTAIGNAGNGITGIRANSIVKNNIGFNSGLNDLGVPNGCILCTNNWGEDWKVKLFPGDPQFVNPNIFKNAQGQISVTVPSYKTVEQKVDWFHEQFENALGLRSGSGAIDKGTPVSFFDPIRSKIVSRSYYGANPDLGAYEYEAGSQHTPPANIPVVPPQTPVTPTTPTTPVTTPITTPQTPATPTTLPNTPVVPTAPTNVNKPADTTTLGAVGTSGGGITIPKLLSAPRTFGSSHEEVKKLQIFLNSQGYTVATVGAGSRGKETAYFGPATLKALNKFQIARRLTSRTLDLTTVNLINSLTTPTATTTPITTVPTQTPTSGSIFVRPLSVGMSGADVKALQVFLNSKGFTVAVTGPGSKGSETTFFGSATKAALIRFQEAYKSEVLLPSGLLRGTGYFGPSTMRKVNSLK